MRKPKDEQTLEMYRLYQDGMSLSQVGKAYGITRQSVYKRFSERGWQLRSLPTRKKYQTFDGKKYTVNHNGYYRKTDGDRQLMHRDVWIYYNGEIPQGWDIHHKDGNKANNDISNLECLPKAEHTRKYSPHNNQYTRGRKRIEGA